MKICSICKNKKSKTEFHKRSASKDGFSSRCKACTKAWRQTEKGKATGKKYRQTEGGKAALKKYRESEKGKAVNKKHMQTEKGKATRCRAKKKYIQNNPDQYKAGIKKYGQSEKGKATIKKYGQSEGAKVTRKAHRQTEKSIKTRRRFAKKYRQNHPDRCKAHGALHNAIRSHTIVRPNNCSMCGIECIPDGHHPSYKEECWLVVAWVCRVCHKKLHNNLEMVKEIAT